MSENKKVIFLDIDGTLTEPGSNTPPQSALQAIKTAQANGHLVFLCSGRSEGMIKPFFKYGFDGFISSSGGYVVCGEDVIFDAPMNKAAQNHVLDICHANNIYCTIEGKSKSYTDEGFKDHLAANEDVPGNSELLRWRRQIESSLGILPMKEYTGEPIYKIVLISLDKDAFTNAASQLESEFSIVVQDSNSNGIINGELLSRHINKGVGIKRVCEHLNVSLEDSIGFGDSMNDKEMLEVVGLSICTANGSAEMQALADETCDSVTNDGIYKAFRKHNLC